MNAILAATALGLVMIAAAAPTAGAQDIHIHVYGDEGAKPGSRGYDGHHGPEMRGPGAYHQMDHRLHGEGRGHDRYGGGDGDQRFSHHGSRHDRQMRRGKHIDRVLDLVELYDQDRDGKVTQAEVDRFRADRVAEFDSDGNGMLSLQEYEGLWLDAMRERMVDRFQSHDDDGDGQVTVEEFSARTSRLVLKRDRNDDQAISFDDVRRGDRGRPEKDDRDSE